MLKSWNFCTSWYSMSNKRFLEMYYWSYQWWHDHVEVLQMPVLWVAEDWAEHIHQQLSSQYTNIHEVHTHSISSTLAPYHTQNINKYTELFGAIQLYYTCSVCTCKCNWYTFRENRILLTRALKVLNLPHLIHYIQLGRWVQLFVQYLEVLCTLSKVLGKVPHHGIKYPATQLTIKHSPDFPNTQHTQSIQYTTYVHGHG